jgi:hypothetical protein
MASRVPRCARSARNQPRRAARCSLGTQKERAGHNEARRWRLPARRTTACGAAVCSLAPLLGAGRSVPRAAICVKQHSGHAAGASSAMARWTHVLTATRSRGCMTAPTAIRKKCCQAGMYRLSDKARMCPMEPLHLAAVEALPEAEGQAGEMVRAELLTMYRPRATRQARSVPSACTRFAPALSLALRLESAVAA